MRRASGALLLLLPIALACGSEDVVPEVRDTGVAVRRDLGIAPDALEEPDAGFAPDADPVDTGPDDTGEHPDALVFPDATPAPDAEPPDTGPAPIPDEDNDGISDPDEGNGAVDTDADMTPDSRDTDSDNDGIPDMLEAGDADPRTPPADTDADMTPDFRDADSDGDGIPDMVEGTMDADGDMTPNFRDTDSDGDGVPDMREGSGDADGDMTPNFLDTDADGDTIPDSIEGTGDPDGDMTPNFLDTDSDGDGIADREEQLANPDADTTPAYLDTDSDGDGILDMVEGTMDPDGDMTPSYLDIDSDGDTIGDRDEGTGDPDGDMIASYLDPDSDGDGIPDSVEAGDANVLTPPSDPDLDMTPSFLDLDSDNDTIADRDEGTADTDGDGVPDRLDIDSDNDSILDTVEAGDADLMTAPVDTDRDMTPDFRDEDSDGDTIVDVTETGNDRDGDRTPNFRDLDSDGDGIDDAVEAGDVDPNTAPRDTDRDNVGDYLDLDSDGDGLADSAEPGCPAGSDRLLADSDMDGFVDPAEIAFGSSPCNGTSGITGFYFVLPPGGPGANAPLMFGNTNLDRADLAINIDTTGSMGGEIANLRTSLSTTIIPGVRGAVSDTAFAVSYFEDYPVVPFGCAVGLATPDACVGTTSQDLPFRLLSRVTRDAPSAQTAVNALVTRNGLDFPEAGLESLYQIAAGRGTAWTGGSVPQFNPQANLVPGVADGTIGGVGFRSGALPIVVHITDAPSHVRADYQAVSSAITAVTTDTTMNALQSIGARVVTVANERLPRDPFTAICSQRTTRIFGRINAPAGSDVDWFVLTGATAGQVVTAETSALRSTASLDTMIGIFNGAGTLLAGNDDIDTNNENFDSRVSFTLTGTGPFYVAVTSYGDPNFDAAGGQTADFYFLDVTVAGVPFVPQAAGCRADDGNTRQTATSLVPTSNQTPAPNVAQCVTACEQQLDPLRYPYGISVATRATIPACSWDSFGMGRPAGCGPMQCCTGRGGAGVDPNAQGQCALNFQIDDAGTGLGTSIVQGIQALARFSPFTVSTVVRRDPMQATVDTRCFIQSVIPVSAMPPNTCVPQPQTADLVPPMPQLDSFTNVTPGTALTFQVNALNQDMATMMPCAPAQAQPQLFRAFIDVVADGVTVLDTRDVIIIVPPLPPGGGN